MLQTLIAWREKIPPHALHAARALPRRASTDMDLSCSESGDDLASSCLSPAWRAGSDCASNGCFQRELSPPISMEVCGLSWRSCCDLGLCITAAVYFA